jgi:hypothetical protein
MRAGWSFVVLLLAAACGGGDGGVPDAGPADAPTADAPIADARLDASTVDAAVDATPPDASGPLQLVVGPPQAYGEAVASHGFAEAVLGDIAWNGSEFLVVDEWGIVSAITPAGPMRTVDIVGPIINSQQPRVACHADGSCAVSWCYWMTAAWQMSPYIVRYAPDGTRVDTTALDTSMQTPGFPPAIGAYGDGYMIATYAPGGFLRLKRIGMTGAPLDAEPVEPGITSMPLYNNMAIACDDAGCSLAVANWDPFDPFDPRVTILRIAADGMITMVHHYDFRSVGAFACAGATCLLVEQPEDSDVVRGVLVDVDGNALAPPFAIGTVPNPNRAARLAVDASGFVLTTGTGVTTTTAGRLLAIRIGFDGTVGATVDLLPTRSLDYSWPDAIACAPSRCLAGASGGYGEDIVLARLDGSALVDDPPLKPRLPNRQETPITAVSDGGEALVAWGDSRLAFGVNRRAIRAARWSTTWLDATSTELAIGRYVDGDWNGTNYLFAANETSNTTVDLVRVSAAGEVLDTPPITIETPLSISVPRVVCNARCLVSKGKRGFVAAADGTKIAGSDFDAPIGGRPVALHDGTGRFVLAGEVTADNTIHATFVSAEGLPSTAIDVTGTAPADDAYYAGASAAAIGSSVLVSWRSAGHLVARTVDSSGALGALVDLPIPTASMRFSHTLVSLGDGAIVAWYDAVAGSFFGLQLAADGTPVTGAPLHLATAPRASFRGISSFFEVPLRSRGNTALLTWNEVSPPMHERMYVVPIQLLPTP